MADISGRQRSHSPEAVQNTVKAQIAVAKSQLSGFWDIALCRAPYTAETGIGHLIRIGAAWSLVGLGVVQGVWVLNSGGSAKELLPAVWFWWLSMRLFLGYYPGLALALDTAIMSIWGPTLLGMMFFNDMKMSMKMPVEVSWSATTARMTAATPTKAATCPSQTVIDNEYAAALSKPVGKLTASDFTPVHSGEWVNCVQQRELGADEVNWCRDTKSLAKLANAGKFTAQHLVTACYRQR